MAQLGAVRGKPSSHLHLPVCTATTGGPGALPAPHSTPSPRRAHLRVLLPCDHLYSFNFCTTPKLQNPGAHSRRWRRPPSLSLDPKARGLFPVLPAATNAQTAQLSDEYPAIGTTPRVAEFSEHAPNAKSGSPSVNSAREHHPPPPNSDRVICSK